MGAQRARLASLPEGCIHSHRRSPARLIPPDAGTHVLLLFFPALGLPLPLRVHMLLQAAKLLVLVSFGVHPHCRSKVGPGGAGGASCASPDIAASLGAA